MMNRYFLFSAIVALSLCRIGYAQSQTRESMARELEERLYGQRIVPDKRRKTRDDWRDKTEE